MKSSRFYYSIINRYSDKDIILAEPISIASTLSLFFASMISGARISFTDRFLGISFILSIYSIDVCNSVQPTIISASNATYYTIYKEILHMQHKHPIITILATPVRHILHNTQYFRLFRQNLVRTLLGDNLRLGLSFYSYRPLSKAGVSLLYE